MRASCAAELIAPTSVFLSSGCPTRSVASRRCSAAISSSSIDSWTSSREPAQHTWPWLKKMPLTMPSTAWSIGASSKTMLAALPPSSRVSFLPLPADRALDALAHLGRAGERDLVDAVVLDDRLPDRRAAGEDVDHARRQVGLGDDLGQHQRRQRRRLGRLEHDGVAGRQRRRDLPRRHQQREVPRDHLAGHAERRAAPGRSRRSRACRPSRRSRRSARPRSGCRRRATRGSACRCRATPARPARGRAPGSPGRCGTGTCRARPRDMADHGPSKARRAARTASSTSFGPASATSASGSSSAGLIVLIASPEPSRNFAVDEDLVARPQPGDVARLRRRGVLERHDISPRVT